jgi:hypothetical protein
VTIHIKREQNLNPKSVLNYPLETLMKITSWSLPSSSLRQTKSQYGSLDWTLAPP